MDRSQPGTLKEVLIHRIDSSYTKSSGKFDRFRFAPSNPTFIGGVLRQIVRHLIGGFAGQVLYLRAVDLLSASLIAVIKVIGPSTSSAAPIEGKTPGIFPLSA